MNPRHFACEANTLPLSYTPNASVRPEFYENVYHPRDQDGRKYDMLDNWPATSSRIVYSLVRPVCQNRPALYPRGIATHTINQIKVCR